MPRARKRSRAKELTGAIKHGITARLRRAKTLLRGARKPAAPARPTAVLRTKPPEPKTTVAKRPKAVARPPRLSPSQRGPRTGTRASSLRPTVGAPFAATLSTTIAPPLSEPTSAPATTHAPANADASALPTAYGATYLALLVRDPWWVYAYWEVTAAHAAAVRATMRPEERAHSATVLRLYDITGGRELHAAHRWFDVVLPHATDNWFVDLGEAHRTWVAELGYRTAQGRFYALVRSNVVTTPRAGPSDVFDEAWMTTDEEYWKLLGVVYGLGFGTSSFEVRQLLERRFREVVSSAGGSFAVGSGGVPTRG